MNNDEIFTKLMQTRAMSRLKVNGYNEIDDGILELTGLGGNPSYNAIRINCTTQRVEVIYRGEAPRWVVSKPLTVELFGWPEANKVTHEESYGVTENEKEEEDKILAPLEAIALELNVSWDGLYARVEEIMNTENCSMDVAVKQTVEEMK